MKNQRASKPIKSKISKPSTALKIPPGHPARECNSSADRYRIMDGMHEGRQIIGSDWRYLYLNDAADKQNRRPKEELLGKKYMDVWPGIEATEVFALLRRCMEDHTVNHMENLFTFPDGSKGWFELFIQPVPEGIFILSLDITERKEIEAGLEKTQAELEVIKKAADAALEYANGIINTVREPLIILDQDLRVVTASRSFYEFFKVTPDQTVGQLIYGLGNRQWDIPKLRELLETILPQKATFDNYEVEHDFATIGRRVMLLNARQIQRVLGKERIILLAIEDITERKEAEEELREYRLHLEELVGQRTAELETSNKELESFAYSVSHDLRAPLRTIDGFCQALAEDCQDKLDVQGQDYLRRVRAATQMMAQLIDDMLKISRVTRAEMNAEKVNLTQMARSVINELQKSQPARFVDIKIADGLEATADSKLMRIALENLLGNAWKFTGKQPEAVIEFGVTEEGGKKVYFIRDNGAGFDMAYADKLFTPFQRLHKMEEYPGTGIGLATVRRIINRHGGAVRAESKLNQGATFYFSVQ